MEPSKSPVTRGALERVLARAAELQAASGDEGEATDSLTEAQIVDLGREVGLSPENIRQAIAEERVRLEPINVGESGVTFQLLGAQRVGAQRIVPGLPERLLATLDRWMQRDEWLRVLRQRSDRIVWEPRPGILGSLRRLVGGKDYALSRANHIAATVVPVDSKMSLVRLEADFATLRRATASKIAAGAFIGSGATGALLVMGFMNPVAIIPAVVLTSAAYLTSRRSHQHAVQRGLLTLEQVLDRLERGDTEPPSFLRMIESALPPGPR